MKKGKKRSHKEFCYIKEVAAYAEQVGVAPEFAKICQRKVPRQCSYESQDNCTINPRENFKTNFYFRIVDTTKNSTKERFDLLKEYHVF